MNASPDQIRQRYVALFGTVPPAIEARLALGQATGRTEAVAAVEGLREELIHNNPLGPKTGQLVHFGQLLALGREAPARLHAKSARRGGATLAELVGVAELALITAGMPAYSLGIEILSELSQDEGEEGDGG